jgi:glutamate/tyrosine decarboxylase-like PLP-dependent enzyme
MHWQSPKFFAYFAANTSPPGILAEMLIGALNMIGFSWQSSPISSELEMVSSGVAGGGSDAAGGSGDCMHHHS